MVQVALCERKINRIKPESWRKEAQRRLKDSEEAVQKDRHGQASQQYWVAWKESKLSEKDNSSKKKTQ